MAPRNEKNKRGKKNRNPKPSFNKKILAFYEGRKLGQILGEYIESAPLDQLEKDLPELLFRNNVNSILNANYSRLEDFASWPIFPFFSYSKNLFLYEAIFCANSSKLATYAKLKYQFENNFAAGRFDRCHEIMAEIYGSVGESFWYIKNKLLLLYYSRGSDELQEFCDEIGERNEKSVIQFIVKSLILTTQSNSPWANLENVIIRTAQDIESTGVLEVCDLLYLLFVPSTLWRKELRLKSIYYIQLFPVIDQYNLVLSFIQNVAQDPGGLTPQEYSRTVRTIRNLYSEIQDPQLLWFINAQEEPGSRVSRIGGDLIKLYEQSQYAEVIEKFGHLIRENASSEDYVTIIAKSLCHLDKEEKWESPFLDRVIGALREIYSLSPKTFRAKEELYSEAIRVNGTALSISIELAICMAMPNQFESDDLKHVAFRAMSIRSETTPLVPSLYRAGSEVFENDFSTHSDDGVPETRKLRVKNNFGNPELIESGAGALEKDLVEYQVRRMLNDNKLTELVDYGAKTIIENENAFICFPTLKVRKYIEDNRLCSLNSVLVCYFYDKLVSRDSVTLLNETFEDFVLEFGYEKPSEILFSIDGCLSTEYQIFFLDICSLEVMDFLSIFQSSDELRVERLIIIEALRNLNFVTKARYLEEAERILNEVVLDSISSKFERSKIYVDEATIRKNIASELETLFEIYQLSSAHPETLRS